VGRADEHWRKSPHEEFQTRSAWSLYNAFTSAAKRCPPAEQLRAFELLRRIVAEEVRALAEEIPMPADWQLGGAPGGFGFGLAGVNSNRCRHAHRLSAGGVVFACTNGMVSGTTILNRRHTHNFDLRADVGAAIATWVLAQQESRN
jgi:hypothetical protein